MIQQDKSEAQIIDLCRSQEASDVVWLAQNGVIKDIAQEDILLLTDNIPYPAQQDIAIKIVKLLSYVERPIVPLQDEKKIYGLNRRFLNEPRYGMDREIQNGFYDTANILDRKIAIELSDVLERISKRLVEVELQPPKRKEFLAECLSDFADELRCNKKLPEQDGKLNFKKIEHYRMLVKAVHGMYDNVYQSAKDYVGGSR